jgi:hypothetical protein
MAQETQTSTGRDATPPEQESKKSDDRRTVKRDPRGRESHKDPARRESQGR